MSIKNEYFFMWYTMAFNDSQSSGDTLVWAVKKGVLTIAYSSKGRMITQQNMGHICNSFTVGPYDCFAIIWADGEYKFAQTNQANAIKQFLGERLDQGGFNFGYANSAVQFVSDSGFNCSVRYNERSNRVEVLRSNGNTRGVFIFTKDENNRYSQF